MMLLVLIMLIIVFVDHYAVIAAVVDFDEKSLVVVSIIPCAISFQNFLLSRLLILHFLKIFVLNAKDGLIEFIYWMP